MEICSRWQLASDAVQRCVFHVVGVTRVCLLRRNRYTVMRGNHLITAMARYRMSSHDLNIERGRFSNIILVVSQYVIPCILWYDFNKLTILYIYVHISFISIHKSVMFFFVNKISVCLCVHSCHQCLYLYFRHWSSSPDQLILTTRGQRFHSHSLYCRI